jgi:hypothetical protein
MKGHHIARLGLHCHVRPLPARKPEMAGPAARYSHSWPRAGADENRIAGEAPDPGVMMFKMTSNSNGVTGVIKNPSGLQSKTSRQ